MRDLGLKARHMLDAARDMDEPADTDRARNKRLLLAGLAAGALTTTATAGGAAALPLVKILVVVSVAAVSLGGGVWLGVHRSDEGVRRAERPAAVTAPAPAPVVVPATVEAPAPAVAPTPRHLRTRTRASTPAPVDVTKEIALLARANAALRDGDAGAALALLDQHDRRFPGSGLAEEVAATRIIARCQLAPGATAARPRRLRLHPAGRQRLPDAGNRSGLLAWTPATQKKRCADF